MDAFFASIEEIKDPSLKTKPLIVASNKTRSVVSTANYEARKYKIKSAMPVYMAKLLCPKLIIKNVDFESINYYHNKIYEILLSFTKKIEDCSIDEWYFEFSNSFIKNNSPTIIAKQIQKKIFNKTGLTCTIGISNNKFLAKMASDFKKPNGITEIYQKDMIEKIWPLKIGDMYMIGKKTNEILQNTGIVTIGDLAKQNINFFKNIFGKNWKTYRNWTLGKDNSKIIIEHDDKKSISNGMTLNNDTNNEEEIKKIIFNLSKNIYEELKNNKIKCKTFSIIIKKPNFSSLMKSFSIKQYTNDYEIILSNFYKIYEKYLEKNIIRSITLKISNFIKK